MITDDSDTFVFGAPQIMRRYVRFIIYSIYLIILLVLSLQGGEMPDSVEFYTAQSFSRQSNTLCSTPAFLLLAILVGGHYDTVSYSCLSILTSH